jgi:hypothetical protein
MHRPTIRRTAAAATLALFAAAPLAACGDDPVAPLPAEAAPPAATATATPSLTAPPGTSASPAASPPRRAAPPPAVRPTKPTSTRPTSTKAPSTCLGAVRYDLDVQNTVLDLVRSMCFHTGGVLRLQGIGPGLVTSRPASVVSQSYEAGVVDLRFIRAGTATVTIPQNEQTHTITVVVVS